MGPTTNTPEKAGAPIEIFDANATHRLITVEEINAEQDFIERVQKKVMKKGEDFGTVGNVKKPTLLKPGAEILCRVFRLDPQFENVREWTGRHLTVYSKCTIYHAPTGRRLGSGVGLCSTKEPNYALREAMRKCPDCQKETIFVSKDAGGGFYCWRAKGGCGAKFAKDDQRITGQATGKVANEEIEALYNTVEKMSAKRSLVDAVLHVTAASRVFAQDLEDLHPRGEAEAPEPPAASHAEADAAIAAADASREAAKNGTGSGAPPAGGSGAERPVGKGPYTKADCDRKYRKMQAGHDGVCAGAPFPQCEIKKGETMYHHKVYGNKCERHKPPADRIE